MKKITLLLFVLISSFTMKAQNEIFLMILKMIQYQVGRFTMKTGTEVIGEMLIKSQLKGGDLQLHPH